MIAEAPDTNLAEWTVSELAGALRRTLEDRFGQVRIRGEVSGYRGPHSSGHAYFCLKDRDSRIDAVIWKTAFGRMRFKPQEGLEVVATGRITTFPGKSTYQIVVESMEPAGAGALMALLDERRRRLTAEGLFATERKRALPFLPRVIGVVTSPTGAVIRDILHRLEDRFPRHVVVWPVRVQGETCGAEVAAAIAGFNALGPGHAIPRPDVIIVARGGGSLEDLWGFNDEDVVRAVAAGTIPLVAAVGHETDWTLIDHAADLRAPTPTGAAEMAVPVRTELLAQLGALARRHADGLLRGLDTRRAELRSASRALPSGDALLAPRRQRLDLAGAKLAPALGTNARDHDRQLREAAARLAGQSPLVRLGKVRTRLDVASDKPLALLRRSLTERAERLADLSARLVAGRNTNFQAERLRLAGCREKLAAAAERSRRAVGAGIERRRAYLGGRGDLLASLGYVSVLARGYALVRDARDRPVFRSGELSPGQPITIEFADGRSRAVADGVAKPRRRAVPLAQPTLFDN